MNEFTIANELLIITTIMIQLTIFWVILAFDWNLCVRVCVCVFFRIP